MKNWRVAEKFSKTFLKNKNFEKNNFFKKVFENFSATRQFFISF
jgi:hypothetical protein